MAWKKLFQTEWDSMQFITKNKTGRLIQFKKELQEELDSILHYWEKHSIDNNLDGFYGKVNNDNVVDYNAGKGLVLNARILWTFSAAFNLAQENRWLLIAERAYNYIMQYFHDPVHGGFYWAVDKKGNVIEGRKQVYGIAFCIYGLAEYYRASGNENAIREARGCYQLLEQYSYDAEQSGYFEAFGQDWRPIQDLRLSAKDANDKKTMNTHLHVLEAYTNLYQVWKDEKIEKSIELLLTNFSEHIVNRHSHHLQLFFDEQWRNKEDIISYGHDIEAAWLLLEAADAIGNKKLILQIKELSLQLARAAEKGIDSDGGLWYESENGKLLCEKHWWPQAEAMVGFFNAWQISGEEKFLQQVFKSWQFIQQHILDKKSGEWFWGVRADYKIMEAEDKIGFWKCPYHNSRACMEIIKRIQS